METGVSGWMRNNSCNTHAYTFNNPDARSWHKMWFSFWTFMIWWNLICSHSAPVVIHCKLFNNCSFPCIFFPAFCFLFTFPIPTSAFQSLGAAAGLISGLQAWRIPSVMWGHQSERNAPCQGCQGWKGCPKGEKTHKDWTLPLANHCCVSCLCSVFHQSMQVCAAPARTHTYTHTHTVFSLTLYSHASSVLWPRVRVLTCYQAHSYAHTCSLFSHTASYEKV